MERYEGESPAPTDYVAAAAGASRQGNDALLGMEVRPLERQVDGETAATSTIGGSSGVVPLALSAVLEGLGQAYNRQPAKALAFSAAGLGLSTASGLNTWLVRNVLGLKRTRIGPERVNPGLLALWTVCYVLNLLDAWRGARRTKGRAEAR